MQTIDSLRKDIDHVHQELHALLLRRRDLTVAIWNLKQEQGLPFFSPEREAQILRDFVALGQNDPQMQTLMGNVMQAILREYEAYLRAKFS